MLQTLGSQLNNSSPTVTLVNSKETGSEKLSQLAQGPSQWAVESEYQLMAG